jgi:hypothetical protein
LSRSTLQKVRSPDCEQHDMLAAFNALTDSVVTILWERP